MNQLCPFCWTELRPAVRSIASGPNQRVLGLLECPHCGASGTSNLIHSHHEYHNVIKRVERLCDRLERDGGIIARELAVELRDTIGRGLA